MSRTLFRCDGGELVLPDAGATLATRLDGGNLLVNPPRPVWERSELTADELTLWAFLVAAAGASMLDALPQLEGGCINYWEAGNWALNDAAEPAGRKRPSEFRRMHLHLLGRSPRATRPSWRWGESPRFPTFAERHSWSAGLERLRADECRAIVRQVEERLLSRYRVDRSRLQPWAPCPACGYPGPVTQEEGATAPPCRECVPPAR